MMGERSSNIIKTDLEASKNQVENNDRNGYFYQSDEVFLHSDLGL
jgi:hypothetical protein